MGRTGIMAKAFTIEDLSKIVGAERVEEYEGGVWYCYGSEKNGKHKLLAIIEKTKTGYAIDAESDIINLVSASTAVTKLQTPLYDTYVDAYDKTALHVGTKVDSKYYFGHKVLSSKLSSMTWEQIRKREYQIAKPKPEEILEPLDPIKELN
jgi:hypothetical protein